MLSFFLITAGGFVTEKNLTAENLCPRLRNLILQRDGLYGVIIHLSIFQVKGIDFQFWVIDFVQHI